MSDSPDRERTEMPRKLTPRADQECDRFESAWKAGQRPRIEDHLRAVAEAERPALLHELIQLEIDYRYLAGEQPKATDFLARFPTLDAAWLQGLLSADMPAPTLRGPEDEPAPVRRLGKFVLLSQLGQGGCGTVWRARDSELDRIVAVKIPDASFMTAPELLARFRREARAVARLSHPNIVTLFEVGEVDGTPLLVMEYVAGTDLWRLVKQQGPLPIAQACECIRQAALGLQHAHENGLVHRDVKPANLLLTAQGAQVKVLDLGLARLLSRSDNADSAVTAVGCVLGTADFMAPEQAQDTRNVDARADVYGLGCSLYYLLTGQVPFPEGTSEEKILQHLMREPTPVEKLRPTVPPALATVVRNMMARRPSDRYQSATGVVAALETVLADPGLAAPATRGRSSLPWRTAGLLLGLSAAVLLLVLGWQAWHRQPEVERVPPPPPRLPPPLAVAPFDAAQAKNHQAAWARHLGLDSEITNSVGMKFKLIPPGKFLRGSDANDLSAVAGEKPQREILISRPFYLGVFEVTQREYEAVMGENPSHFQPPRGGGPNHPVEMVDFADAEAFCKRLTLLPAEQGAGRSYRLPREAEWEYACRAGSQSIYYFGNEQVALRRHAWFEDNADGTTHPVGQHLPNAWGLLDMTGNVWEWCADYADPLYYERSPAEDPECTERTDERVLRGGGFGERNKPFHCRAAMRGHRPPFEKQLEIGMRVVCSVPP
jgi:serine/threonine protein kinase